MRSLVLALVLLGSGVALGCCIEERPPYPSFDVDRNSWAADEVVYVASHSGTLHVLETWKGSLRPGSRISVAALGSVDHPHVFEAYHFVLFLRKGRDGFGPARSRHAEMDACVAFVESSGVFGLHDDPDLWRFEAWPVGSLDALKERIAYVRSVQESLARVEDEVTRPVPRALALAHLARVDVAPAREEAIAGLRRCEDVAVHLLAALAREEEPTIAIPAIAALGELGAAGAGTALAALVAREARIVRAFVTPTLEDESDYEAAQRAFASHEARVVALLEAIVRSRARAVEHVRELDEALGHHEWYSGWRPRTQAVLRALES